MRLSCLCLCSSGQEETASGTSEGQATSSENETFLPLPLLFRARGDGVRDERGSGDDGGGSAPEPGVNGVNGEEEDGCDPWCRSGPGGQWYGYCGYPHGECAC
jgi:hypothetical protein